MPDSFTTFATRFRANWHIYSAIGILCFSATVTGADAQFQIGDQGKQLSDVRARVETQAEAIAGLKQQADDILATENRIEAKIDEMMRRQR